MILDEPVEVFFVDSLKKGVSLSLYPGAISLVLSNFITNVPLKPQ